MGWLVGRMIWPVKSRAVSANDEWLGIVERFVRAAMMAEEAGWEGVQLHAAHGYLLAEYLSPLVSRGTLLCADALQTNPKPIPLPRVPTQIPLRLHLLYLILTGIHAVTRSDFVKSVKVNCSDFVQGGASFPTCIFRLHTDANIRAR